jgi:hypothetical protein
MENIRFMSNMNDKNTNETEKKDNIDYDVEDIDPGEKLVNYLNNGKIHP